MFSQKNVLGHNSDVILGEYKYLIFSLFFFRQGSTHILTPEGLLSDLRDLSTS